MAKLFGTRYPWDQWFGKRKVILIKGRDFFCKIYTFAQMTRNAAKTRYIPVTIETTDNGVVIFPGRKDA